VLLALALGACAPGRAAAPATPAAAPPAAARAPAEATEEGDLAAADEAALGDSQREALRAFAAEEFCPCGCPHTLEACARDHGGCAHAKRALRLASRLAARGLSRADLGRTVTEYYASFDRRARLDVAGFGPPKGDPAARVTIVEFSDFTCPFCQLFRPRLEGFVLAREGRVNLVYKPFPIASHPNAWEAAQAAEWARAQGAFWPMHDLLFAGGAARALSEDDLAGYATELGLPADDLRAAVAGERYRERIAAAMAEARAAGLRGTPTLFVNGRRYTLPLEDAFLEFTLEDEEEWVANGGRWARD
jgi:protein-disulfide isomerase